MLHSLQDISPERQPSHLAIGIFDGVHRGHQAVIDLAIRAAQQEGTRSGVLTFTPHPSRLFHPDSPTLMLMPLETKAHLLKDMGVDEALYQDFTREFAALEAEAFLPYLKSQLPALKTIYIGENFRFGKKRAGNPDKMSEWAQKLALHVVSLPGVKHDGQVISSTRIREHLSTGNITEVNTLLGYPYFSEGTVTEGQQLGRTLGFPTLNFPWNPELRPAFGVYTVRVSDKAGRSARAVANYGLRPTVNKTDKQPQLEVHCLEEACPWSTGDTLKTQWLAFLRPEQSFSSAEVLKAQIQRDCEEAREWWHAYEH